MDYLAHHGVRGQKWGVRRFQNKDGSLTSAGKKRASFTESKFDKRPYSNPVKMATPKSTSSKTAKPKKHLTDKQKKAIIAAAIGTTTIAAATIYAKNHPEVISKVGKMVRQKSVDNAYKAGKSVGKTLYNIKMAQHVAKENIKSGIAEGFREATKEAPKTVTKTVIKGATLYGAKKYLDSQIGKENTAIIFQANNKDKIDKFWKVNDERDKDDDRTIETQKNVAKAVTNAYINEQQKKKRSR